MCEHDTLLMVDTIQKGERKVDACIAHLIAELNRHSVKTLNSCCGHGKTNGNIVLPKEALGFTDFGNPVIWLGKARMNVWKESLVSGGKKMQERLR